MKADISSLHQRDILILRRQIRVDSVTSVRCAN